MFYRINVVTNFAKFTRKYLFRRYLYCFYFCSFPTEHLWTTVKLVEYIFWESFCASLDKSILFYRRWLMSRFSEIFFNSCGFPQFSLFSRQLVFSDRKHFCSILTDLSNLSHIKWSSELPFARLWFENCSYKTLSKNADAAVLQNRFS